MNLVVEAAELHAQTNLTLLSLLMGLMLQATALNGPSLSTEELHAALHQMQTANYFSFVILINMYPPDRIPGNVTFLMPNDRMLSKIPVSEGNIYNFLLRHSIPSPLLFDHLKLLPSGSMIPTSEPDFMLRVNNNGSSKRSIYLNDVQIISPNICTSGSSIRCHGIKGVLTEPEHNLTNLSPICSPPSSQGASAPPSPKGEVASPSPNVAPAPASLTLPPLPAANPLDQIPMAAPPMMISPENGFPPSNFAQQVPIRIFHTVAPGIADGPIQLNQSSVICIFEFSMHLFCETYNFDQGLIMYNSDTSKARSLLIREVSKPETRYKNNYFKHLTLAHPSKDSTSSSIFNK